MAFDVGSVVAKVTADISDFKRNMGEAQQSASGFKNRLVEVGGVMRTAVIAGSAAAAAGVAILGKSAIDAAGDFQQTRVSFETMLGSAAKAQKLLAELQQFAKKTPFSLTELQDGTKRLLAYGVEADKVIDTMSTLGNITSAVGRDKMPQLILAFGQVKAAGRLMGTELRQFTETGVPLLQVLADQFKVSTAEIQDMVSAGKIGFEDVQTALNSLGGEGGRWGEMMDKQSKTLQGSLSNLSDSWNQLLVVLGTAFLPIATQIVQSLTSFLTPIMNIIQGTTSLSDAFGLTAEQTALFEGVLREFQSFLFDTLIPAVIAVSQMLTSYWNAHKAEFIATWNIIKGFVQLAWSIIYGLLKVGLELLAGDWNGAWKAIVQMTQGAWNGIKSILTGALSLIYNWGSSVFEALVKPFRDAWNNIQDLVNKIKDKLDFTKRHSPSVVDIVNRGVDLVNKGLSKLDAPFDMGTPSVTPAFASSSSGGSNFNSINVDLSGAVISDEASAMRIGEMVGDSIVKRLKETVRV